MVSEVNIDQLDSLGLVRRPPPKKEELGQEDFLELMTAQLQNQDPFKPLESGEFLAQIAQFASTRGIQEMQNTFTELASSLQASQSLQASNLVGREVLVETSTGTFAQDASLQGMVDVPAGAQSVLLRISDETGQVVRQVQMDVQGSGLKEFEWDGIREDGELASPGLYTLDVTARVLGESVAAKTFLFSQVDSVSIGGEQQGITLNLKGIGARTLDEVREIR